MVVNVNGFHINEMVINMYLPVNKTSSTTRHPKQVDAIIDCAHQLVWA